MKKIIAVLCMTAAIMSLIASPVLASESIDINRGGITDVSANDISAETETPDNIPDDENIMEDIPNIETARMALQEILAERNVMALVYLSDKFPVRQEASYESAAAVTVSSGQQVQIRDIYVDASGEVWNYVALYYKGVPYYGYVPRTNLALSDEIYLKWEEEYGIYSVKTGIAASSYSRTAITYADINQFPESYRAALTELKQAHPNWTFVKMNTGLNWNTVVSNQLVEGRSLIETSSPAYMQNGVYSSGWAYASEAALKYYLDPRNGLNESTIFQFELLTYNESYHTKAAVQNFLNNTFMSGTIPNLSLTYSTAFWAIGKELGVSPFHLACRVYQEQGQGNSPLISGTYSGYEGYYNYFNIGASGTTNQQIYESGLARAKQQGWTNGYLSIYGGAQILSANYILKGQDTLYLQKFDVDDSYNGLYWHQYMQNIAAPGSEAKNIRKSYVEAGSLDNTFVFKIPVYENMPSGASELPTSSYEVALTAPSGYNNAVIFLDGMEYTAALKNGRYVVAAPNAGIKTAIMYKYNEANVPVGMYVWTLSYRNGSYTATAVEGLEDLLTYHGFSIRITGNSGIRFKTGLSADVRSKLTGGGISGYTLKEYGTLVMNNANRSRYSMVLGGEKVAGGRSYGKNDSGVLEDKIFETVSGRYRYTSVLVNLPVNQYKTEFAFRGYIVLTKDGNDITLYGPIVSKSIYSLAQQLIASGQYEQDSGADQFLRKLISDADSVN